MTNDTTQPTEREEIEMLVPFYVTGRISTEDARRVDDYLKRNPDFAEHIELARDERVATVSVNEALGFPSARSADRIFEAIAAESPPRTAAVRAKTKGVVTAIRDFFTAPTAGAVRYVALAAAAIVLLQAAILSTMLSGPGGQTPGEYQTASGPKEAAATGNVSLVAFQEDATLADITRVLTAADAKIIEGPVNGGLYKIRLAKAGEGQPDAARRIAALKAETGVIKMVVPSK
jgi:anti-sigma factor RsiW